MAGNADAEVIVYVIEVTDLIEARRAKFAQYSGVDKTLMLAGQMIVGVVKAVSEVRSGASLKWIVSIALTPERKPFAKADFRMRKR